MKELSSLIGYFKHRMLAQNSSLEAADLEQDLWVLACEAKKKWKDYTRGASLSSYVYKRLEWKCMEMSRERKRELPVSYVPSVDAYTDDTVFSNVLELCNSIEKKIDFIESTKHKKSSISSVFNEILCYIPSESGMSKKSIVRCMSKNVGIKPRTFYRWTSTLQSIVREVISE